MKQIILALCISAIALPAAAIQRYNIQTMSCSAVQQAVQNDGAAILRWRSARNPTLPLYDRFVRNRLFCDPGEYAKRVYVPTRDRKSCVVRKCADVEYGIFSDN